MLAFQARAVNQFTRPLFTCNVQRHLIFHPWAGCPWEGTVIDGQQWLLCLTRCRGPLDAHVFQDLADSEAFTAPILLAKCAISPVWSFDLACQSRAPLSQSTLSELGRSNPKDEHWHREGGPPLRLLCGLTPHG